jgi:hypothetical protein
MPPKKLSSAIPSVAGTRSHGPEFQNGANIIG